MAAEMIAIVVKIPQQDVPLQLTFASSDTIKCVAQEVARRCDIKTFQLRKRSVHLKFSSTLAEAGIVSGVKLTVAKIKMADPAHRAQLRLDHQGKTKRSTVHTQLVAKTPTKEPTTTAAPEEATTAEEPTTAAPEEATTAEEPTTTPELIQTKECTFTYHFREAGATSMTEELEKMASEVGMTATRGIDIPMLQGGFAEVFSKGAPLPLHPSFPHDWSFLGGRDGVASILGCWAATCE